MKLLTFAVPCYNSAAYMEHCIETLLPGGDEVEILIVDDGSVKDDTAAIADRLEAAHPGIIRAIHQENKGHGGAVNTGLAAAQGLYFKVVDSDDWVDPDAYRKILQTLRRFAAMDEPVDMLISNYTYENVEENKQHTIRYTGKLPEDRIFSWQEIGHFRPDQNILMHSVIFRTRMLRDCGISLPEHCFYVDNIFVYEPLPHVRTLYYLNVDFYRYLIGRCDQSVNESVFIRQVDQQVKITYHMLGAVNPMQISCPKRLRNYLLHYLSMMIIVTSVFLVLSRTPENEEKRRRLWQDIRDKDERLYKQLHYRTLCGLSDMPIIRRRQVLGTSYRLARKIYRFN